MAERSEYQRNIDRRTGRARRLIASMQDQLAGHLKSLETGHYGSIMPVSVHATRLDATIAELEAIEEAREALKADRMPVLEPGNVFRCHGCQKTVTADVVEAHRIIHGLVTQEPA
jgi:hypothetical protein